MYIERKYNNTLYHHGILGMKWGVRKYQYEDGSVQKIFEDKKDLKIGANIIQKDKSIKKVKAEVEDILKTSGGIAFGIGSSSILLGAAFSPDTNDKNNKTNKKKGGVKKK